MSNPKVFEFAKEIGMTPLALMDKIREWHIPVKSHMAELAPEVLETIKQKLDEEKSPKDDAKKVSVKKAAPKKTTATAAKKASGTKEKVQGPVKPTAVRKKAAASAPAEAEEKTAAAESGSVKTVVRRKAAAEAQKAEEELLAQQQAQAEVAVEAEETPIKEEATAEVQVSEEVQPEKAVAAVAAQAPPQAAPPAPGRKKEVVVGQSGHASPVAPASIGRKNIIGRMDLSRVSKSGPDRGAGGGGRPDRPERPGGGDRAGGGGASGGPGSNFMARTANMPMPPTAGRSNPRNLRTGFVSQSSFDEPQEEEIKSKFDEKKKRGVKGEEGENFVFNATEYRKREMVFQPKKKKGMLDRQAMQTQITTPKAQKRVLKVFGAIKLSDAAQEMGIKAPQLTKVLMQNGVMATMNTEIDYETIALIAPEFGWEVQNVQKSEDELVETVAFGELDAEAILRPPVVTVMGHVDHGKTSLLDAIRNANVASGEAGGITQHIGAYQVKLEDGHLVTFLDTPGHEAFTAMRARGANATDIAIIVVAADDGLMPQTAEAINHAKAAGVPIIVAVNKMDKPGANIDRIKQQLTEFELVPEEWGGTTIFCPVSALQKTGIKELLEQIILVAEMEDLKANPKRSGSGVVIESRLEKGRGSVATLLVQDGTIKIGQYIVAGKITGRVRSLMNDKGERVQEAGPSVPVEVLGLDGVPSAGDRFDIVVDERAATQLAEVRKEQEEKEKTPSSKMTLEELFSKVSKGDVKELPIILKADVAGSVEAIQGMFSKLSTPEVKVKIVHAATGGVTESDVLLASTAKGLIIGFNVRPDSGAQAKAKNMGIEIRTYSIVYELVDDIKKAMTGLLTPDIVEKVMGSAEVRNTFSVPKIGTIAGCFVTDGKIQRSNLVRLVRDGKIVYEGKIGSLKRFKDDAKEVASGFECGIGIENFNDVKVGDVMEAYIKEEVARELSAPTAEA